MRRQINPSRIVALVSILVLALSFGWAQLRADAGPGQPQEQFRAAAITADGHIQRAVLLAQGVKSMPNTTPQAGSTVCINGDASRFAAQLTLSGTMTGTNPVVTVVLQHSIDGGVTWRSVGSSFAAINSTVTPAAAREDVAFSDVAASTAVVWGNCFRTLTTWAGTGTVTANLGVALIAK
jgi:hypothetical protein